MDSRNLFLIEKRLLLFSGFYPKKGNYGWLYGLRGFLNFFLSLSMLISIISVAFLDYNDLSKLTESLLLGSTHSTFFCKLVNFLINRNKFIKLEELLGDPIFQECFEKHFPLYKKNNDKVKKFAKLYRLTCVFCILFYLTVPLLDASTEYPIPFPGIFLWHITDFYVGTYLLEIVMVAISAFNNSTLDILSAILINIGTSHFEILQFNLQDMHYARNFKKDKVKLKNNLKLHQYILKYVKLIEDIFSYGIFVQFMATVFVLCFTCFQLMIVSYESTQFIFLINYFCCMLLQVSIYCWYGHEIMAKSIELPTGSYMSNWYESDVETRKMLILFMERTKKPVVLTAGKFFTLTLNTLTTILRSSYSYFAVLRQVYK